MGSGGGGRLRSPGCHRPRQEQTRGARRVHPGVRPVPGGVQHPHQQHGRTEGLADKDGLRSTNQPQPGPLIAPKYSFTGIPWWTTWVASVRRLVSEEAFQDMDDLLPTVSKDFEG